MGAKFSVPTNPMNSLKNAINSSSKTASDVYQQVSKSVSQNLVQITPTSLIQTKPEVKVKPVISEEESNYNKLCKFEKDLEPLYKGCYSDDPTNPSMKFIDEISNSSECIQLGRKHNYKYVGIQQGDKCYGSNVLPVTAESNRYENCNIGCDDIDTGNCGGFFYNQVYETNFLGNNIRKESEAKLESELESKNELISKETFENFSELDSELYKISKGVNNMVCSCINPINSYMLFVWIIILIILIYLLFEYLLKKI